MKALGSLTEVIIGLIFLVGASVGVGHLFMDLKKETFVTMRKFMKMDFEQYTEKLTRKGAANTGQGQSY